MEIERGGLRYVHCELCNKFATLHNADALGWDWFTGSLPRTHHYCTKHKTSRQHDVALANSRIKQEQQP